MSEYGNYHDTIPNCMLCNGADLHFCIQWELECLASAFHDLKQASKEKNIHALKESAKEYAYHSEQYDKWRSMANEVDRTR